MSRQSGRKGRFPAGGPACREAGEENLLATLKAKFPQNANSRILNGYRRPVAWFFVSLCLLVTVLFVYQSIGNWRTSLVQLREQSLISGHFVADGIQNMVTGRFHDLEFLRNSFLGREREGLLPEAGSRSFLAGFGATHPGVYAVNILGPSGQHVLWTSGRKFPPLGGGHLPRHFRPVAQHPGWFLGCPGYSPQYRSWVLPIRIRILDAGRVAGFMAIPLRLSMLDSLHVSPQVEMTVLENGSQRVVSVWKKGHWYPPDTASGPAAGQVSLPVGRLPWKIRIQWAPEILEHAFWQKEWPYVLIAASLYLLLLLAFLAARGAYGRIRHLMGELSRQAFSDTLTGLPNRRALDAGLDAVIGGTPRPESPDRHLRHLALAILDLDDFKAINDCHGHEGGDQVLQAIAGRLLETRGEGDFVARLGGDEFVVLSGSPLLRGDVPAMLEKIGETVTRPIDLRSGARVQTRCSAGVCLFRAADTLNADLVLRNADQALYAGKSHKSDRAKFWAIYGEPLALQEHPFQILLREGGPEVWYQPVLDTRSRRITGVEALTRLTDFAGKIHLPGEFLPHLTVAEITTLSLQALRQALAALTELEAEGHPLWISLNVAPESLAREFTDTLARIIEESRIPPSRVTLEILESGDFLEQRDAMTVLHGLKTIGVRLALDDVGSAYSSLLRLKELPIDEIKLDQGFVRTLEELPQDLYFVAAIRELAQGLGTELVVEGVETDSIQDAISALGIHLLQGFGIARPMPLGELKTFLAGFRSRNFVRPQTLLGVYAKQVAGQGALDRIILENPRLLNREEYAKARICSMHGHLEQLGIPENSPLYGLHEAVHHSIASLPELPGPGSLERFRQAQKDFENGLLLAFQAAREAGLRPREDADPERAFAG